MKVKASRDLISSHTNTLLPSNTSPSAEQMRLIQMNLIKTPTKNNNALLPETAQATLMKQHAAVMCYAEELRPCFIDVLWSDSFTVVVLAQVSVMDIPGGGRRMERRMGLNRTQDVAVCWWPLCNEEVRPWSPIPSAADRVNLVLLACSDTPGLTVSRRSHGFRVGLLSLSKLIFFV